MRAMKYRLLINRLLIIGLTILALLAFSYTVQAEEDKLLWEYKIEEPDIESISVSSDGSYVAVGSAGGYAGGNYVYLFNKSGKLLWKDIAIGVRTVLVTSDGSVAVGYGVDYKGSIYIRNKWKYKTERDVRSISISPDGSVAVGTNGGYVYFFNKNGNLLWKYKTEGTPISSILFSLDGSHVSAGSLGGYVYFFNKNGELLWKYRIGRFIKSISTSSNGSYVAVGTNGGYVYFFGLGRARETPSPTPTETIPTQTEKPALTEEGKIPKGEKGVPGFEALFALVGLLAAVYAIRRFGR